MAYAMSNEGTKIPKEFKLKKNALHEALGIAPGKKIPMAKLKEAKHSKSALMRKRANFALNAKKFHHK